MTGLTRFYGRVSRFVTIYSSAMGMQLVLGLATTILIVRNLDPAAYGVLGLYLLVPSTVMVVANIGLLQATNYAIFQHAGENVAAGQVITGDTVKRVLGTGLLVSVVSGTLVCLIVLALSPELASALGKWPHAQRLVVLGAASGAVAGIWRFVTHMLHYARRPVAWAVCHISRALFSFAAIVILLNNGRSVEGVILGFGIGSLAGVAFSLLFARNNVKLAFDRGFARQILTVARSWISIVLAYHIILGCGIYFVSLNAGASQVGLYSLALSISVVAQYAVSASIYSSGPMKRSSLRVAAVRERGEGQADAYLLEGYSIVMGTIVVFLGVFGNEVLRIAPNSYAGAAGLIPLLALPAISRGFFAFTYSLSARHDKKLFQRLGGVALVLFVIGSFLLGPLWKAYGIAVAATIALAIPALIQLVLMQRSANPLPLHWRRILVPLVLAATIVPLEIEFNHGIGWGAIAVKVGLMIAFLVALLVFRVIPIGKARSVVRQLRSDPRPNRGGVRQRVRDLAPSDSELLRDLLRHRRTVEDIVAERDASERAVLMRFMTLMRSVAELDGAPPLDWRVSRYLMFTGPYGERDNWGRRLVMGGADPLTLDQLEQVANRLRRLPPWAWTPNGDAKPPKPIVVRDEDHVDGSPEVALVGADSALDFVDDGGDDV